MQGLMRGNWIFGGVDFGEGKLRSGKEKALKKRISILGIRLCSQVMEYREII